MNTNRADRCATCGRPRGISLQRESWSLNRNVCAIPRTTDPGDNPWQCWSNDVIRTVSIYRNGGTDATTHLCDDCLRIAIRSIVVDLHQVLDELDAGHPLDSELATATERLANIQEAYAVLCFAHDRMQDRLAHVLSVLDKHAIADDQETKSARWEVARGRANKEAVSA